MLFLNLSAGRPLCCARSVHAGHAEGRISPPCSGAQPCLRRSLLCPAGLYALRTKRIDCVVQISNLLWPVRPADEGTASFGRLHRRHRAPAPAARQHPASPEAGSLFPAKRPDKSSSLLARRAKGGRPPGDPACPQFASAHKAAFSASAVDSEGVLKGPGVSARRAVILDGTAAGLDGLLKHLHQRGAQAGQTGKAQRRGRGVRPYARAKQLSSA